jgi:hypothetical protein
MQEKRNKIIFFSVIILLLFITSKPFISGQNDLSRFCTIKVLVENHTFAIDYESKSVDTVYSGGKYYSSKPPVLSLIGAGVYWIMYNIFDQKLILQVSEWNISVYFINLILMGGAAFLLILFFYKSLNYFGISEKNKYFLCSILILSTIIFSYFGSLNNHLPSAALIFISFYYLLKQIRDGCTRGRALFGGFLAAVAFTIEPIFSGIFIFCTFIFQIFDNNFRRNILYFILGLLPMGVLYVILNVITIGRILPINFYKDLYIFPGSYWSNPIDIDILNQPKIIYLFNVLIGTHGLFIYSPILIFSLFGFKKILINQEQKAIKGLTLFILISILIYILTIVIITNNYGGNAYGIRWFICFIPILFFYLAIYYKEIIKKYHNIFIFLLTISILFCILGYLQPWNYNCLTIGDKNYYIPLLGKIAYLSSLF